MAMEIHRSRETLLNFGSAPFLKEYCYDTEPEVQKYKDVLKNELQKEHCFTGPQRKVPMEALPLSLTFDLGCVAVCGVSVSPCMFHLTMLPAARGVGEGYCSSNRHSGNTGEVLTTT